MKASKATVLLVGIVIADAGCRHGCTQATCDGGVNVRMDSPPAAGPYRLEVAHPVGSARLGLDCVAGPCEVFMPDFYPSYVNVYRIVGSDTTVWGRQLTYTVFHPNGEDCTPECRNANVTIVP